MWQIGASPWPHLPEFLSVEAVRDLSRQGSALQPAETHNSTSILLCQIPGSTVAAYFPDGYLLSQGAPWVQLRGNVFHQVSANLCQVTLLSSSSEVSASIPASLAATSPWHSPRQRKRSSSSAVSAMGRRGFSLPSPRLAFLPFPGSGGTILALFPLSDLALGLTRISGCIVCTGENAGPAAAPPLPPGHPHPPAARGAGRFSITQTNPPWALRGDPCGSVGGKDICRDSLMLHCWWG